MVNDLISFWFYHQANWGNFPLYCLCVKKLRIYTYNPNEEYCISSPHYIRNELNLGNILR